MGVGSSSLPETTERGKEREEDEEGERRKERGKLYWGISSVGQSISFAS